ncbi:cysteine proteinase [Parathielavia hyrcaniae]|uniref:Cysteine proteinase n=1 Tax=Parathielavia hyrcaniae TaxID=113614 RepID=A0AAN6PU38_9PEZI|nr:cysteine proteinase [Parathielavia hyrcaniae]
MHAYSDEQVSRYLQYIVYQGDARQQASQDPIGCLTTLQRLHMARVPFESLSLHYSRHRLLSLDPQDLFAKIVGTGRGGYCMEVNAFFAAVLRGLGFTLYSAGGRVKIPTVGYTGWDHMVNLVTIQNQRYLVDVGFGSNGPPHPIPLQNGHEYTGISPARGRLQHRHLSDSHSDPHQRVWLLSTQDSPSAPWTERYHFVETEFLPGDFELMNLRTMTTPQSFFVQSVMCLRTILDDRTENVVGVLILHRDYVKRRVGAESEIVEQLESEAQRVGALEKYYDIVLSPEEQRGIWGLASELRPKAPHA